MSAMRRPMVQLMFVSLQLCYGRPLGTLFVSAYGKGHTGSTSQSTCGGDTVIVNVVCRNGFWLSLIRLFRDL